MGNKESKGESKQVAKLRKEVEKVPDRITEGVVTEVSSVKDVVLLTYEDLEDPTKLVDSISHVFENAAGKNYLKETAALIFKSLRSDKEMKSMEDWHERTKTYAFNGKVYGLELHYTARGLKRSSSSSSTEFKLMLGYKMTVNTMEGNPKDYPEYSDLKALEFSGFNFELSTIKPKPNEPEMIELLGRDIRPIWMVFAGHLNIDPELRDQIKEDCERNSKMCLLQAVQRWLKEEEGTGDLPRTWTTIASAVEKCGCVDLAARVKDMHLKSSSNTE